MEDLLFCRFTNEFFILNNVPDRLFSASEMGLRISLKAASLKIRLYPLIKRQGLSSFIQKDSQRFACFLFYIILKLSRICL